MGLDIFKNLKAALSKNLILKAISLALAIGLWFYIVNELEKGTEEEKLLIQKLMPSYGMTTKKLMIRPIIVGKPKRGYRVVLNKVAVVPEYCIVVGPRKFLKNVKYIFTMPIDVSGAGASFSKTAPLKPIAPGIYMEETLVMATVPVEPIG